MKTPRVSIDLEKIEHNPRSIVALYRQHNIEVWGVTRATCGHPEVAKALLAIMTSEYVQKQLC